MTGHAMEPDRFLGAWRVLEHVYDPGTARLVGLVHQERRLESIDLDDGRPAIRVTQVCRPDDDLVQGGHPMAGFAGEWVFDLVVEAPHRRYLGPDVVGSATQWAPGAMTGQGIWPRFGHTFDSWSLLVHPERQLTGGWFHVAGRPVATIIGVAVPLELDVVPVLGLEPAPAGPWVGTAQADGRPEGRVRAAGRALVVDGVDVLEGWQGVTSRWGPMLVADGWAGPRRRVRLVEVHDDEAGEVLGILTVADGDEGGGDEGGGGEGGVTTTVLRLHPEGAGD